MDFPLNPLVFVLVVVPVMFAALAIPAWRLVAWWSDGVVDGPTAVCGFLLFLILVAVVAAAPLQMKLVAAGVILIAAMVLPLVSGAREHVGTRQIADDRLDRYLHALQANPLDAPARIALAEELGKRGHYDQAIEHLDWVLREFPRLRSNILPKLDRIRHLQARPEKLAVVFCHECRAENALGTVKCSECGATFRFSEGFMEGIRLAGGPAQLVRAWIVLGVALPTVAVVLLELPTVFAAPIVIATLITAAWLFLRWVGGDTGSPG